MVQHGNRDLELVMGALRLLLALMLKNEKEFPLQELV
jgi:hypothetical protein